MALTLIAIVLYLLAMGFIGWVILIALIIAIVRFYALSQKID